MSELYHHGVKGMKWGVRRYQNEDGGHTRSGQSKYSDKQYWRDRDVYGRLAARRIDKRVSEGSSLSGARSYEADRIARTRKGANVVGEVVGVAGAIGSIPLVMAAPRFISRYTKSPAAVFAASYAVGRTAPVIMSKIGKYFGQSTAMLLGGYSPSKYRS